MNLDENGIEELYCFTKLLQASISTPYSGLGIVCHTGSQFMAYDPKYVWLVWREFENAAFEKIENFTALRLCVGAECCEIGREIIGKLFLRAREKPLEFLKFDSLPPIPSEFRIPRIASLGLFRNLKTFKISCYATDIKVDEFYKELLSVSPNWVDVEFYFTPEWLSLPVFKSLEQKGLVKYFSLNGSHELDSHDEAVLSKFVSLGPQLRNIALNERTITLDFKGIQRLENLTRLMSSSRFTLEVLTVSHTALRYMGDLELFGSFPQLQTLELHVPDGVGPEELFKSLDFSAHFPALKLLVIVMERRESDEEGKSGICTGTEAWMVTSVEELKIVSYFTSCRFGPRASPKIPKCASTYSG